MKLRHYFEYALVFLFRIILMVLPRRAALWLGRRFGDLFYLVDGRHRREVLSNLDIAYGDEIDHKAKKRIARKSYEHFASILFDLIRPAKLDKNKIDKIATTEGWENLEEAIALDRGVLVLTAHYGFWELMGVAQGFKGRPLNVLARKLDNPFLERLLYRFRTKSGNTVLYKQNAVKAILELLRDKQTTAVLIDQNVSIQHGIFVDFFGVPASTTPIISALAMKTGAPIVPAFSLPMPGGKWRFIYEKPLFVENNGDRKEMVRELTQRCTNIIENYIRKQPEIWLWMHRRWKTRPPEENGDA